MSLNVSTASAPGVGFPEAWKPAWKLYVFPTGLALVLFFLALLATSASGAPRWAMIMAPGGLSLLLAFFLWPTLALVVWALACGLTPRPVLGQEIFLYDLFTVILFGLWLVQTIARGRFEISGPDWAVLGVVLAALLSILMNVDRIPEVSERFLRLRHFHLSFPGKLNLSAGLLWLGYLSAYLFASRLADTPRKIRWVLGGILATALGNSLYALWRWLHSPLGFSRHNRTMGLLQDAQDQGYLSAFVLMGLLIVLVFKLVRGQKWLGLCAAGAVILLNLVFNFTRSVYAEFALGISLLLLLVRSRRLIVLLVIGGILLGFLLHTIEVDKKAFAIITRITSRQSGGLTLRMVTWLDALRISREEGGFWGIGLGNYLAYSEGIIVTQSLRMRRLSSAHGMYVQILAEQGIPGLLAWGAFFTVFLRYHLRHYRLSTDRFGRALNLWLFVVLAMYLLDGFVYMGLLPPGHSHEALQVGYYVWMALGLGVAYNRYQQRQVLKPHTE